jgi:hypothetical protein
VERQGANAETLGSAAALVFIHSFPLLLADAVRRAHPISAHQFQIVPEGAALAPGIEYEDPQATIASAWIDVSQGPVVVRLPDPRGRHFTLTLIDSAGETFASYGARTGQDGEQTIALVSPDWHGELPAGLTAKRTPSDRVWAVARFYAHSALDRKATLALMRGLQITDLESGVERLEMAQLAAPGAPSLQQAIEVSPTAFFHRLDNIIRRAALRRPALLAAIANIREELGGPPPFSDWGPGFSEALEKGLRKGLAMLKAAAELYPTEARSPAPQGRGEDSNGWVEAPARAVRAWRSMGAPASEDLLLLTREVDSTGRRLNGRHSYHLHFRSDAMPPARALWRLYTRPAPSPHQRNSVSDRSDLTLSPDGSVDIFIRAAPPPPDRLPNWLPAPAGPFILNLALHWPTPTALSGAWRIPPVELIDQPVEADVSPDNPGVLPQPPIALRTPSP